MSINHFRTKVNKLSPSVKKIMLSNKTFELISDIFAKYKLNKKQKEKVAQITGRALIKEIPLNNLVNNLKTQANLNLETAKSVTFDIIKNFFIPIKRHFPDVEESMKKSRPIQSQPTDSNIVDLKNQ
jgi:transcriptional accessory protein Tex/SPT6